MTGHDAGHGWQIALEATLEMFAADAGTLHLMEGQALVLVAHVGMPDSLIPTIERVPVGKGMAGLAAQRNLPVDSCDIQTDATGDVMPGARATSLQGALAVPMRRPGGAVAGVLGIGALSERQWSSDARAKLLRRAAALVHAPCGPEAP